MYHFLGIVTDQDILDGNIVPSYILCQSHGEKDTRSGWRVIKQEPGSMFLGMNKVLVKTLIGNEAMIDFFRNYQTRDHEHGDKHYTYEETKKYYPKGALFWFECNEYGEPGQCAIMIRRIPDKSTRFEKGFRNLKESRKKIPPLKTVLAREPACELDEYSHVKPKLAQRG